MPRIVRLGCLLLIPLALALRVSGFSLLGPRTAWMTPELSYGVDGSPGGPMNVGDEYRWNVPEITYGFDEAFVDYFGERGVAEVEKAIAVLNGLPAASDLDMDAFPLVSLEFNNTASALDLVDLQSFALVTLLEQLGLAAAEQNVFCLRSKEIQPNGTTLYSVVQRNFDPVTWQPTFYVNGCLFSYLIHDFEGENRVDAVEFPVDNAAHLTPSVAGFLNFQNLRGCSLTGLTRDDVGGLRYLLSAENRNVESLPAGTIWPTGDGGQTTPPVLRPGIEKLHFTRTFSYSFPLTNAFVDRFFTNGVPATRNVQRILNRPDITFSARDLGPDVLLNRSVGGWKKGDEGQWSNPFVADGPGIIEPGGIITFNKVGPVYQQVGNGPFSDAFHRLVWASFDSSAVTPFVYPASAAPVPVTISFRTEVQEDGNRLVVWNFRGAIGQPHQIFASNDLSHWEPVGIASSPSGLFEYRLTENGSAPLRFFKAERQ